MLRVIVSRGKEKAWRRIVKKSNESNKTKRKIAEAHSLEKDNLIGCNRGRLGGQGGEAILTNASPFSCGSDADGERQHDKQPGR